MAVNKEIAVSVRDVHKEFILPQSKNSTFKQSFVNIVKKGRKVTQKTLDGVSFDVYKGDFFGIVGRNGSGKSTMLKILAGVYTPTSGSVHINGGLTPFIELGVGFNPELSGRDNVYLNGALLGFTRKQMNEMYDDIVAFAELEPFMDQKLKNYSSGMQVRLAFSIAIKAENDILVFDEVLAVGDSNFQEKCIRQFKKFKKQGKTIILVTHSMDVVSKFCNRTLLINAGEVVYDGEPEGAIDRYEALNMEEAGGGSDAAKNLPKDAEINSVTVLSDNDEAGNIVEAKQGFTLEIKVNAKKPIQNAFMAVRVCESENQVVMSGFDTKESRETITLTKGENTIRVKIENTPLIRGKYYIVAGLYSDEKREVHYAHYNGLQRGRQFLIKGKSGAGFVDTEVSWLPQ